MIVGVPKEIKNNENRVAMTPAGVVSMIKGGHQVLVETGAGLGSGFPDYEYEEGGALLISDKEEVFSRSEMIMKVKEPLPSEYGYLRPDQLLFTYLHLAAEQELTETLLNIGVVGIAYETIELEDNTLPLLTPMSEVAGRMSVQIGAQFLQKPYGGKGILLGGVPGVAPANVVIIGGGVVGRNAAQIALGMGADVTLLDNNAGRLRELDSLFHGHLKTLMSNEYNLYASVKTADLLIGAVLIHGGKAPHIVTEEMVMAMNPGSVIVDVAIDQGGCIETVDRVTTHSEPTFTKHGVIHYSVANIPGAVARTSTIALTNVTMPYALQIANKGFVEAVKNNSALAKGVNVVNGKITYQAVAVSLGLEYTPLKHIIG